MTTGRGFIVCAAAFCALLTSCSSTSLVACSTDADCAPYAGTVCYEGFCRKPSTIKGDVDFAGIDFAPNQSMPDGGNDLSAAPEPADLSLFCGDGGLMSCPASTPVCDDNECRACTSADNAVCASRSMFTPHCDQPSGTCIACTSNADCLDATNNTCSFDGSCRPACSTNTDCAASGVCDYGTFNGTSVCARADEVVYVRGNCGAAPDGSMGNPFCTLDSAVTKLANGGFIMLLTGGSVIPPSAQPFAHSYVVTSHMDTTIGSNAAASGIAVTSTGNVLLNGLQMSGLATAILCTGGKVRVLHTIVTTSTKGIDATSCTLNIDSTWLNQNGTGASLHGTSGLQMTNSIVSENTTVGLSADGTASMFLNFDTIANNVPTGTVGAIASTSTQGGLVYNSIVYGNTQVADQSWTGTIGFQNCDSDSSAAGTYTTAPTFTTFDALGPGGGFKLVNTYHLVASNANNTACCVDKGKSLLSGHIGPKTDYDGDARPKGAADDIGADEVQ